MISRELPSRDADLEPFRKTLACGDTGDGAMKDWKEIVKLIEKRMDLA